MNNITRASFRRDNFAKYNKPKAVYKKCYEDHPAMPLPGGFEIYGGNCGKPVVTDADDYVGLDGCIQESILSYPWYKGNNFLFPIPDMGVPADIAEFRNLLGWLETRVEAGKKVHVGCIGGHGRTGMVLAALYTNMGGGKRAIHYVRENYCKKAVESEVQVKWLMKHFDIAYAPASKGGGSHAPAPEFQWAKPKAKKVQVAKQTFTPRTKSDGTPKDICVW